MSQTTRNVTIHEGTLVAGLEPLGVSSVGISAKDGQEATYRYHGTCPVTGCQLGLSRTRQVEEIALGLCQQLSDLQLCEGKMFGVLLVQDSQGRLGYGKAFSGCLQGRSEVPGWAPPLHLPTPTGLESDTLAALERWKVRLQELHQQVQSHGFLALEREWSEREVELRARHRSAKRQRDQQRLSGAQWQAELERESRRDSVERRDFRRAREAALEEPRQELALLRQALTAGKKERRALSRALQGEMHQHFASCVASLLGCPLETLFPAGIPTGTGDCCAPKLLAWAARHELKPLAMAELWWGPTSVGNRVSGQFYAACQERCQPLLGPLLSVALRAPIRVLYRDDHLLVIDKPSGLLAVPGRYHWCQDSVLCRLRERWPGVLPVHRLDLETSGVMVLALGPQAQAQLRSQFAAGTVQKLYLARLDCLPVEPAGRLRHPIGPDPKRPGCYRLRVDGKLATTDYELVEGSPGLVKLVPRTGRSHQLRVHLAQALGCPIRGDKLYYPGAEPERLQLHSWRLGLVHPGTGERLTFEAPLPF